MRASGTINTAHGREDILLPMWGGGGSHEWASLTKSYYTKINLKWVRNTPRSSRFAWVSESFVYLQLLSLTTFFAAAGTYGGRAPTIDKDTKPSAPAINKATLSTSWLRNRPVDRNKILL